MSEEQTKHEHITKTAEVAIADAFGDKSVGDAERLASLEYLQKFTGKRIEAIRSRLCHGRRRLSEKER